MISSCFFAPRKSFMTSRREATSRNLSYDCFFSSGVLSDPFGDLLGLLNRSKLSAHQLTSRLMLPGTVRSSPSPFPLLAAFTSAEQRSPSCGLGCACIVPGSPSSGVENYSKERIPRARFFDLDLVSSPHPMGLKHMLPTAETFALHVCQ
jgi:hypothetical protein